MIVGLFIVFNFNFKKFVPILARHKDASRGGVPSNAVENIAAGIGPLCEDKFVKVDIGFDLTRCGIYNYNAIVAIKVCPDAAVNPLQLIKVAQVAIAKANVDSLGDFERRGVKHAQDVSAIRHIHFGTIGGYTPPLAAILPASNGRQTLCIVHKTSAFEPSELI